MVRGSHQAFLSSRFMSKSWLYELFSPPLLLLQTLLPESAFDKWAFPLCWVKQFLEIKPAYCSVHIQKNHVEHSGKIHAKFLNPAISLSTDKYAQASSTVTSKKQKQTKKDFTGSPVVKTPCFQCRGPWLDHWLGNKDPTCHGAQQKTTTTTTTTNSVTSKGHSLSQVECITWFFSVT